MNANRVSLVEECADLTFEYGAAIHPVQVEGTEHLSGCAAIQPFYNLIEQLRGGLLGEDGVFCRLRSDR